MRTHLLAAAALVLSTTGAVFVSSSPAQADPRCSSFSYGIGNCVNQGWNNGAFQPSRSRYSGGNQPTLLEQPRFQPNVPQGYYPSQRSNGYFY
ncbi:hypothetical protein [Vulcanococcus limneticus]|uniref:hypothetical protein n=1 Tax=Vulcanococcus limneticus TaxID=2170428 RepID=UPI00398BC2B9